MSWEIAQTKARRIEAEHLAAEQGETLAAPSRETLQESIALFLDSKRGENPAEDTLYKHGLTLRRLQDFCERQGLFHASAITLAHLTTMAGRPDFRFAPCEEE